MQFFSLFRSTFDLSHHIEIQNDVELSFDSFVCVCIKHPYDVVIHSYPGDQSTLDSLGCFPSLLHTNTES
eukprot:UN04140